MKYSLQKRISAFVLAFALVMTTAFNSIGATTKADAAAKVKTLYLTKKTTSLVEGETGTAQWAVKATKATKALAAVKVTTSDSSVVKITKTTQSKKAGKTAKAAKKNKGTVKFEAVSAGTATIKIVTKKKTKKTKSFKVTVTAKSEPATTTQAPASADATTQAPADAAKIVKAVTLSNTAPKVGDTISATVEFGVSGDATATYAWYMGDSASATSTLIEGATTASLAITEAMAGKYIKVQANGSDASSATATTASPVKASDEAELAITAKQIGASKILVTANKVITKEDSVSVSRGSSAVNSTFVPSGDGQEIVITTDAKIGAAEYTVKVTPKDTNKAAATAKFTGVAATLEKIDFVGDELILTSAKFEECRVKIFGYDSFGEKVSLSTLQPYTTKGSVDYASSTNEIVVKVTDGIMFTTGESITITAVYQDGATVKQVAKALKVSEVSSVKNIVLGELQTSNANLKGKPVNMTNMKSGSYYKTIVATDQYGNTLTAKNLSDMLNSAKRPTGTLFITGTLSAGSYVQLTGFDTLSSGEVIAKYGLGGIGMPGTQQFIYTAVGGFSVTDSITVVDDPYIANLTITVPELYGGKEAGLDLSATDQNGDAVDLYDFVSGSKVVTGVDTFNFSDKNNTTKAHTTINVPEKIKLTVEKNTVNHTLKFSITPASNISGANETRVLTVQTAAPSVSNVQCVVQPDPKPYSISVNLKSSGTSTATAKSGKGVNLEEEVQLLDQYGSSYKSVKDSKSADFVVLGNVVGSAATNLGVTNHYAVNVLDADGKAIADITNVKVAGDYTVNLYYDSDAAGTGKVQLLDSKKFSVYIADTKYSNYAASLKSGDELLFIGANDDSATIDVSATDSTGAKVSLDCGTEYTLSIEDVPNNLTAAFDENTLKITGGGIPMGATEIKGNMTANVFVGTDLVTSVKIPYSNKPGTTTKYVAKKGSWATGTEYDLSNGVKLSGKTAATYAYVSTTNDNSLTLADNASTFVIKAVDEYGLSNFKAKLGSGNNFSGSGALTDYGHVSLSGTLVGGFEVTFEDKTDYAPTATSVDYGTPSVDNTASSAKGTDALSTSQTVVVKGLKLLDQHKNGVNATSTNIEGTNLKGAHVSAAYVADTNGNITITISTTGAIDADAKVTVTILGQSVTVKAPSEAKTGAAWTVI